MEIIPRKEPQRISFEQYQEHTPEKLEMYENNVFFTEEERINMLKLLMTNVGIKVMVENLLPEARKELIEVAEEIEMERKCLEVVEQVVSQFGRSLQMNHEYQFNKKNNILYIYCHVLDTNSLWAYSYFYNSEDDKFIEKEQQVLESAETLKRLMNK
jgi:hypothetical protein